MADLKRYREKREADLTPEPMGNERRPRTVPAGAPATYLVQQHAARSMHWDLRLEIDGVLVSWAVPRGPTLDPSERRLAVRTEDHPLEYADFEGVIPEGNYGAGAMILWDRGSYHTVDGVAPARGIEDGKLDLWIEGHKLRGRFALVRTKGEAGKQWLLLRKGDPPGDGPDAVERWPASVLSGLDVGELRDGASREAELLTLAEAAGAPRRGVDVAKLRPMLAATGDAPFSDPEWLFELKYDGMRAFGAKLPEGGVQVRSRSGRDVTAGWPELVRALERLPVSSCVVDGEIVCLGEDGRPSFERLQGRWGARAPDAIARAEVERPGVLQAFDVVAVAGRDLRACPLAARKEILARLVPALGPVRYVDHIDREGEALYALAEENGFEGIVAKRRDARYESRRSSHWQKLKVPHAAPLVVVGFTPGKGSRKRLGSLMLAWYRDGELVYAGNVGSGLGEEAIDRLLPQLESAALDGPAFANAPARPPRGTRYVRPELAAKVRFTEVTSSGQLRHPVLLDLDPDRPLAECVAPADHEAALSGAPPVAAPAPEPEPTLTRLDKVFWPDDGYTKGDLLAYYEAVWPWLAPFLRDRPLVLTRYPDGIDGKSFFQKNAPDWTPGWALHRDIEGTDYFVCNDLRTLLHVINSGAIPLHIWNARCETLDRPDWLVLDLDPKGAPFADVVAIARHIHRLLGELGAPHLPKTSGQDGLHVFVPLDGSLDHDEARALGEVVARVVCSDLPEIATIARPMAARGDRVYVDYLQNGRGKLIASPYSARPRAGAPISMPLRWSQVTRRLDPGRFTIRSAVPHLEKSGNPWADFGTESADVGALIEALGRRIVR